MSHAETPPANSIAPLPYHCAIVDYLRTTEPELWQWACSAQTQSEFADEIRTGLLKANYRLDADAHPDLAQRCANVAARLGVTAPITLYQANGGFGMNAMVCHLPNEAHIVFTGPILTYLKGAELDAVLAHELAHYHLWTMEDGVFLTADRLLTAAANDPRAAASHSQTARRFRLYTEIFADRGALTGCQELHATVAALVKTETGLPDVSAASYLRQADEIFSRETATTQGIEHPETFIRARALRLWSEGATDLDLWLTKTIEGTTRLDELDLPGQRRLVGLTRRFLHEFLRPKWFQTPPVLAHACAFFTDFSPGTTRDETVATDLRLTDPGGREYLAYLMLDFVAIDPDLEDVPLASALQWSESLGIATEFEKAALKELGLGKRQFNKVKRAAEEIVSKAEGRA